MATLEPTTLPQRSINQQFTEAVAVTFANTEDPNNAILSVSCDKSIPNINVLFTNTNITLTGSYDSSLFSDNVIKCITRNSSDRLETPRFFSSFFQLNNTDQLISYTADPKNTDTATFTVVTNEGNAEFTQTVLNNYSGAINSIKEFA